MRKQIPQIMWGIIFAILNGGPWASWYSASAQINLPTELQGEYTMSTIMTHFCADEKYTCLPSRDLRYICCGSSSIQCLDTEHQMCMEDDQVYVCGYRDAIVCRYEDGSGSCIYSNSPSGSIQPLCVCKENGEWPTSDAQESQIRGSCKGNATTMYPGQSTTTSSMSDQTTATSSMSDQTTATSSMSDQTTAASSMSDQTTATLSMSDQTTATSSMSDQTTAASSMSDHTTETNAHKKSDSGEVNIIAIVLGTILVLFLLVLLVVGLLKRKRKQRPSKKATTNPTNSSAVSSAAPESRLPVPAPLVPSDDEYEYVEVAPIDHKPAEHDHAVDHSYANVKIKKQLRGLSRFVKHKHGSPWMPNLPPGIDRIAPKLPTKDTGQVYEVPDVKTTTKATGIAAIRAVKEVSSEGLQDEEETVNHTYFERK